MGFPFWIAVGDDEPDYTGIVNSPSLLADETGMLGAMH